MRESLRTNPCNHDLGPDRYIAWHSWADAHSKAGSKQKRCDECGLWVTTEDKRSAKVKKYWKDLGYKS
jgi:hypothetical protein